MVLLVSPSFYNLCFDNFYSEREEHNKWLYLVTGLKRKEVFTNWQ